jgi:hypothetical protein
VSRASASGRAARRCPYPISTDTTAGRSLVIQDSANNSVVSRACAESASFPWRQHAARNFRPRRGAATRHCEYAQTWRSFRRPLRWFRRFEILAVFCETFAWQRAISRMAEPVRFLSLLRVRVASEALSSVLPMGAILADAARPPLLARPCRLSVGEGIASVAVRKGSRLAVGHRKISASRALLESIFATSRVRNLPP